MGFGLVLGDKTNAPSLTPIPDTQGIDQIFGIPQPKPVKYDFA